MNNQEFYDKYIKHDVLDAEEQAIEDAIERGEYQRVENFEEEKKRYQQIARDTIGKSKSITIRLNENDLRKLKAKAIALGIPYQTLIGSALHQYAKKDTLEI